MNELQDQENQASNPTEEEYELNHTDKLVGVFTSPGSTFTEMSKFPPKTIDWVIPVLIMIVIAVVSNIVMMSNPMIKNTILEKRMEMVEKSMQSAVEKGQISQEKADEQLEKMRDRMESGAGNPLLTVISSTIVIFLLFFIISGIFYLFIKLGFKGEGTYSSAMVAYGLPYYILILQAIVVVILALAMNRPFRDTSIASFLSSDRLTLVGWFLAKLDIFSIWFFAVISIGFAKMFKSESTGKYFALVFGLWLGFSLLMYFAAHAVPFLRGFAM